MMWHAHSSSSSCLHISVPLSSLSLPYLLINKHCADPQNEEYGSVAKTTSFIGYEPNVIDNFDFSETFSDFPEWIRRHRYVNRRTRSMWNSTMSWSECRYLHHCSFGSEKNQRTWDKLITLMRKVCYQLSPLFTRISTGKPEYEPSANLSQQRKSILDLESRTSIRFWQRYPGINWNYWFSANGNWSYYHRVWAIYARSNATSRRNIRTKSGSSWNLFQEYARHGRIAEKSRVKGRELSRRKIDWRLWGSSFILPGLECQGDLHLWRQRTRSTQILRLTTSTPGIRWLHHCTFRSEKQVRACCRLSLAKENACFMVHSQFGENRRLDVTIAQIWIARRSKIRDPEKWTQSGSCRKDYLWIEETHWFSSSGNWAYSNRVWTVQTRTSSISLRIGSSRKITSWYSY